MDLPRRLYGGLLVLTLSLAVACGDETPPQSGSGTVTFALVGPQGGEGAMLVDLTGAGIGEVSAVDGDLYERRSESTVRVFVVREDAGQLRFGVELADTLVLPQIELLEVAGADNALRSALGQYDVEVVR